MLSRVAETLYWMSRYIERAEDMTRILAVNFQALLDTRLEDVQQGWQPLVVITGDEDLYREHFSHYNAQSVSEFLLWHPANPNSVVACLTRARENARSVREQISIEMWEHLNRLYFLIKDTNRAAVLRGPHEFFRQVRDGSQAFQGIAEATMTHGDAHEFIQLGKYLERADKTARILDVKYAAVNTLQEGSPAASLQLIAMLKSCSAFEPFRKAHAAEMQAARVAEYLLLSRDFPRAVYFCLDRSLRAINTLLGETTRPLSASPVNSAQRLLGRLCAEMEYLDISEVLGERMDPYLNQLLIRLNQAGDEIARTYFNTQVILPGPKSYQAVQAQQ
jgi:uncharacterized alpha-E superfamily protein